MTPDLPIAYDGDTFRHNGALIRVADIDAPEFKRKSPRCRTPKPGVVCDDAKAEASRAYLESRLDNPRMTYTHVDANLCRKGFQPFDRYGRMVVRVFINGCPIAPAMVRKGFAVRWECKR